MIRKQLPILLAAVLGLVFSSAAAFSQTAGITIVEGGPDDGLVVLEMQRAEIPDCTRVYTRDCCRHPLLGDCLGDVVLETEVHLQPRQEGDVPRGILLQQLAESASIDLGNTEECDPSKQVCLGGQAIGQRFTPSYIDPGVSVQFGRALLDEPCGPYAYCLPPDFLLFTDPTKGIAVAIEVPESSIERLKRILLCQRAICLPERDRLLQLLGEKAGTDLSGF